MDALFFIFYILYKLGKKECILGKNRTTQKKAVYNDDVGMM